MMSTSESAAELIVGKKRKLSAGSSEAPKDVSLAQHDQENVKAPAQIQQLVEKPGCSGCGRIQLLSQAPGEKGPIGLCDDCIRSKNESKLGHLASKVKPTPELQRRPQGKAVSMKYKISVGWQPAPVVWRPPKVKTIECSVFLTLLYLHKFVRESVKSKPSAADLFGSIRLEVISTPKLMKEHLKVIMRESKINQDDMTKLKALLSRHRALMLCFYLKGQSNAFKLDLQSTSPCEISVMYKEQVSRSTENLFMTSLCSCGHPSHTPRLTIALKLMSEVIAAATISVFTVHFRGRGKRPMVLLEILGLAVKKGDLMGKGLGRLMIAYLRHLAHRIQYDLEVDVGMVTKTSNDSAAWWASVPSFYSFREASKRFDKRTKQKWKTVLTNSQSELHMFYSHFNLARSYIWAPELDRPSDMESLDVTYLKVLRRIVDVVASRGAPRHD